MANLQGFPRLALGCAVLATVLTGQDSQPQRSQPQRSKDVGVHRGGMAPKMQVQEWLRGDPVKVKGRARDSTLVLVFWSTADKEARELLAGLAPFKFHHLSRCITILRSSLTTHRGVSRVSVQVPAEDVRAMLTPGAVLFRRAGLSAGSGACERFLYQEDAAWRLALRAYIIALIVQPRPDTRHDSRSLPASPPAQAHLPGLSRDVARVSRAERRVLYRAART